MRLLYILFISICCTATLLGQKLESYQFLLTLPGSAAGGPYSVGLYKVTYNTSDASGQEHVASGLLAVPSNKSLIYPMACYQHGTVSGRADVPSKLAGGYTLAVAFAAQGYVVAAPDFVGLGDSPGIHPYIHAKTEASAGLDMLLAIRELDETFDGFELNDQLFISGYSQGGHAAMALQKEIELNQSDKFTITASAPMSGPYDVSGKMVDFTLGDQPYSTVAYLAWLTLGYLEAYPDELAGITLADVFRPEYIDDIEAFKREEIDLWNLNTRMSNALTIAVGAVIPKNILTPEILDALKNDPTHPLSMALADNNLYNWVPQVPTRMYYCKGDDQVTYENALVAEQYMKDNGAPDVAAVRKDTDAALLDHGGCVLPSALDAIAWFGSFQELLSNNENLSLDNSYQVYYAEQALTIESEAFNADRTLTIHDMTGKLMAIHNIAGTRSRLDLSDLNGGFYLIQIIADNQLLHSTKVVKH